MELVPDDVHKLALRRYSAEHWNAAEFARVAAWGKKAYTGGQRTPTTAPDG
jgi:hypothetical protein